MAMKMYGGGLGTTRTLRIGHENLILKTLLPYLAMIMGMALMWIFAFFMHLYIFWFGASFLADTFIATGFVLASGLVLGFCSYRFFGQRKAIDIKEHAVITTVLSHVWMLLTVWSGYGAWIWAPWVNVLWVFGCIIIGLSWCIRRWAQNGDDSVAGRDDNTKTTLNQIGLGDSHWRGKPTINGEVATAEIQLDYGHTVEDAKRVRDRLAGVAGLPTSQVHVSDVPTGRADRATVTFIKDDPFKRKVLWTPGEGGSIARPIEVGTYQNTQRAALTLSGHNGGSLQHFQVMGVSGVGKSKLIQGVYGRAVSCTDINIIAGDPIKGLQTLEPLAEGLAIMADNMGDCVKLINRLNHVITVRTNYLTSKGLSHWEPGCGLKFEVFHLEEFARFHKVNALVELTEAARSAGIMFVFSLQRASSTRQKTDIRFNLGGAFCFGVHDAVDTRFALSEYTINAGATPHHWQDRYPGRFYLEAMGIDPRMFAMPIMADWVDINEVRSAVNEYGAEARTMDPVSAEAWGDLYAGYQSRYAAGAHAWQRLREGGTPTLELGPVDVDGATGDSGTVARPDGVRRAHAITKVDAEALVWMWLREQHEAGIEVVSFGEIKAACLERTQRSEGWLSSYLTLCVNRGALVRHERRGHFYTPVRVQLDHEPNA